MKPVFPHVKAQEEDLVDPQQTLKVLQNYIIHSRSLCKLHNGI
jgi:hypothetical protein